jgi:uncharacterized membrane protein
LAFAAAGSGYHYRWLRAHGVPAQSGFFTKVDRGDDTVAVPLVAAVILGLAAGRVWLHLSLAALLVDPAPALSAALSALSSLAALGLIAVGQRRMDLQVRGVGVLVMGVVGVKVFAFDLLASHGLPLVLSVLSFGIAVGVGATLLRRAPPAAPVHGDTDALAPKLESGREDE